MTKETRQARVIRAVVQKLRVVQTLGWLRLRLFVSLYIRCSRRAILQNETEDCDNGDADQNKLEFFGSLFHLVFAIG